jgi:purine-binding chemotaxis protein CheW
VENQGREGVNEYLTFMLADELYAVNVSNIKEVLGVPWITRVPRMPEFMNGVINLRGNVVPVLDLRQKFGLGATSITIDTGIIVTEVEDVFDDSEDECFTIGIFGDKVQQVITIDPSMIEPPPRIGVAIDTDFIVGMGRLDDGFVIILNIDKILSEGELIPSVEGGALHGEMSPAHD